MDKEYFKLVTAEVHFSLGDQIGNPTKVNVVSRGADNDVKAAALGHMQHSAAQALTQKIGEAINVHDVIILAIMDLGYFTAEEFNNLPMTVSEEPAPEAAANDTEIGTVQ